MIETWDKNQVYRTAVSSGWRERLLMSYKEYLELLCGLEEWVKKEQISGLAKQGEKKIYGAEGRQPWIIERSSGEETVDFNEAFLARDVDIHNNNCYVRLNQTAAAYAKDDDVIISVYPGYKLHRHHNTLPHRIERYAALYKKEQNTQDTVFVVDGKYRVTYKGKFKFDRLEEAFADEKFQQQFNSMLDLVAQIKEYASGKDKEPEVLGYMQSETMASAMTSPLEYMILDTLAYLSETGNRIIKDLTGKRTGPSYLAQAEKEGLISSVVTMQDCLNVRNFMYHQWDTLDGIGKFNDVEMEKSRYIRQRFLDSYGKLCDQPLNLRLDAYRQVTDNFVTLIEVLNPHYFAKKKDESNSKFIKRLKEFQEQNPSSVFYVDTRQSEKDKNISLIKSIEKMFAHAVMVNKSSFCDDSMPFFAGMRNNFLLRRKYIDLFQEIEYKICQYCLFAGKNYTPVLAWEYFRRNRLINVEEANKWGEYKKLRNELSHRHFDDELYQRIEQALPALEEDIKELRRRMKENAPILKKVSDTVYRAYHKNGLMVEIDFAQKKVLNAGSVQGQAIDEDKGEGKKGRLYVESYPKDISITLADDKIVQCKLGSWVEVDYEQKCLSFGDGMRIYYNQPDRLVWTTKGGEKIFTDKKLKVLKFISHQKFVNFGRHERFVLSNRRMLQIGYDCSVEADSWLNNLDERKNTQYEKTNNGACMVLDDDTKILIEGMNVRVFHKDIELTYQTRKKFAESYAAVPGGAFSLQKMMTR